MEIARQVATRSTCLRRHVGAVIVRDKRILCHRLQRAARAAPHCDVTRLPARATGHPLRASARRSVAACTPSRTPSSRRRYTASRSRAHGLCDISALHHLRQNDHQRGHRARRMCQPTPTNSPARCSMRRGCAGGLGIRSVIDTSKEERWLPTRYPEAASAQGGGHARRRGRCHRQTARKGQTRPPASAIAKLLDEGSFQELDAGHPPQSRDYRHGRARAAWGMASSPAMAPSTAG
jgi:hypothetical protein